MRLHHCTTHPYIPMAYGFLYLVADHRLGQPGGSGMAAVEHQRCELLRGGAGGSARFGSEGRGFSITDQGSTFTAEAFASKLVTAGVAISMDGRSRLVDNIFIERLWRSIKYEEVHLKAYADGCEARSGISSWMNFYNFRLPPGDDSLTRCRWRCGAPAWTKSRWQRGLWICRFAWTCCKRVAHIPTAEAARSGLILEGTTAGEITP